MKILITGDSPITCGIIDIVPSEVLGPARRVRDNARNHSFIKPQVRCHICGSIHCETPGAGPGLFIHVDMIRSPRNLLELALLRTSSFYVIRLNDCGQTESNADKFQMPYSSVNRHHPTWAH